MNVDYCACTVSSEAVDQAVKIIYDAGKPCEHLMATFLRYPVPDVSIVRGYQKMIENSIIFGCDRVMSKWDMSGYYGIREKFEPIRRRHTENA